MVDMKEMDAKGELRFQINDLITKLPVERLKDVLDYVKRENEIYELDKQIFKLTKEVKELEEEAKRDRVNEIKSGQGEG